MKLRIYILAAFILLTCPTLRAQIVTTIAGIGTGRYNGDSIAATTSSIGGPKYIALDNNGNIIFPDNISRIRKIDNLGIITTILGDSNVIYTGDGGLATAATTKNPDDVCVDKAGNIYFTESAYCIRKISTTGFVTRFAGIGTIGYSGDGGPATAAQLGNLNSVIADKQGNIYITDGNNYRIRKVDTAGIITTFAGTGVSGNSGDGGPATAAKIGIHISGIWIDHLGNFYFSDVNSAVVRKINTAGIITTILGNGVSACTGDGGPATAAQTKAIFDIATDTLGNMYLTETLMGTVRKIDAGGVITTIAGDGTNNSFGGDGGPALAAKFYLPRGIKCDKAGNNIYVMDGNNYRIRKISYTTSVASQQKAEGALRIAPNPAPGGAFSISLANTGNMVTVMVYDILGRCVATIPNCSSKPVPVQLALPPGLYLATAQLPGATLSSRLVVE